MPARIAAATAKGIRVRIVELLFGRCSCRVNSAGAAPFPQLTGV
jgi:hypothetical protein